MPWSAVAVAGLAALSVLYLTLTAFVLRHRDVVAAWPLVAMLVATKIWTICYALELSSKDPASAGVWSALKFVGIVALGPALWSFVREYTGKGPLSRRTLGLLLIEPAVVLTLLAIPHTRLWVHHYEGKTLLGAPVPDPGWAFWPHAVYTYVVMFSAVVALMLSMTRIASRYRRQGAVLVAASALPMVGNALWNASLLGRNTIDPTPGLFGITAVVLVWGFFRLRLLDLIPIARGVVIEQMADAVMVLDAYGRVADANPAVTAILGSRRRDLIGRSAADLLPGLDDVLRARARLPVEDERRKGLFEAELELPAAPDPGSPRAKPVTGGIVVPAQDLVVSPGDWPPRVIPAAREEGRREEGRPEALFLASEPRHGVTEIAVSLSGVTDALGREIACIVMLRDVTDRNRTDRRLRVLLEQQTRLSDVLRQSLLPSRLPDVAGLRMAARYLPAPGGGVGGDFYDVHPTDDGRWAFVLGDVSGKGAHAAVVTSTARHTVRSLSAQGWRPRQVLEQLNRVLVSPEDPERFCTVVYGQVDPPAEAGGTVRLVLTLGGHPPPLIRRRDGTVLPVGLPGTVLGTLPEVLLDEVVLDLRVGDVLLAYTDGVTEARCGDHLLGEEGLVAVLGGVPDVQIGMLADAVVDTVEAALAALAPPRDDVALLALAVTGRAG